MVLLNIGTRIALAQPSGEQAEADQTPAGVAARQDSTPPAQQELRQEIDGLKKEIKPLKQANEEEELEKLRQAASAESSVPTAAEQSAVSVFATVPSSQIGTSAISRQTAMVCLRRQLCCYPSK